MLHVIGELDTLTAPLLAVRLAEQQSAVPKLVVDLSEVSFLGSAGLAALVEAKDAADNGQGSAARRARLAHRQARAGGHRPAVGSSPSPTTCRKPCGRRIARRGDPETGTSRHVRSDLSGSMPG